MLSKDINEFLGSIENTSSQHTLKNYRHYLLDFLEFSKDQEITRELIHKYKLHLSKKGYKKTTQNYFLIALRSFVAYLQIKTGFDFNRDDINLLKHERPTRRILSGEDFDKLLSFVQTNNKEGLRDAVLLNLLAAANLKVSEVSALNREDVNKVRINPSLAQLLERYLITRRDLFRPLFIRYKGGIDPKNAGEKMRLTPRSIERMVKKYSREAQIEATPESIRQTFQAEN